MPNDSTTPAQEERTLYACKICGVDEGNHRNWCNLGCGRDYNEMVELPRSVRRLLARAQTAEAELEEARAERDRANLRAYSPTGDNHHNAAACPYCGDLLGKERKAREQAETALRRAVGALERITRLHGRNQEAMAIARRAAASLPDPKLEP